MNPSCLARAFVVALATFAAASRASGELNGFRVKQETAARKELARGRLARAVPQGAEDAQGLLFPAPAGWRHERLEFPLEFAHELEFRGYEDLAFAPGMFAPDSDSYFSYALALRLEGDVPVDEAWLARFLETYYRGLCRAVAAERGIELDTQAIRARARRAGGLFRATVAMFDPFTTGEALDLELELSWHAAPRATELLGLASPLARDAPIWDELRAIAEAWRAVRPAPVFLNHVYAVVDRETYDALRGSSFLRETFAVSEERETVRADLTYSGLYFYGQRTYFEFLPPTAAAGLAEGNTGLALGVESEDGLDDLARRLEEHGVKTRLGPISRQLGDEQVPWFRILGVEMPPSRLNVFALEYDRRFLAKWQPDLPPLESAGKGSERAAVLERYAAALERSPLRASAPFADVTEVELALDEAQRERLLAACAAAGHEIEVGADAWTCHGPQFRLVLRSSADPGGVTGFVASLSRPIEHEPLELGRIRLSFQGAAATLVLRR